MKDKNTNLPFDRSSKKVAVSGASSKELSDLKRQLYSVDVKGDVVEGYSTTSGALITTGQNWYSYWVDVKDIKTFTITHKTIKPISVRLCQLDSNGAVISRVMIPDGDFTVDARCTKFAINFPTPNSLPTLPVGATLFPSRQDLIDNITIFEKNGGKIEKLTKEVLEIPSVDYYVEKQVPFVVGDGYYANGSGNFAMGTGWYSTLIPTVDCESITMKHADTTNFRIIYWVNDVYYGTDIINTNVKITLPKGCNKVTFNFSLANSVPDVTLMTDYASKAKIEEIKAYVNAPVYKYETLSQKLSALGTGIGTTSKTLRIFSIGNSFSQDADEMLYDIAKSAGVELIIGNMYMGGQTLQGHMQQVTGNLSAYTYQKRSSAGRKDTANVSLETGIKDEPWDIITFQQGSPLSGQYETFQPYLNDLITYVKGKVTNANVKYAMHMTWAYASTSTQSGFDNYNDDQLTMYNAIVDAYLKAMQEVNFSILIPSGTSVQNARTNPYLMAVGQELTRDGYHMDLGIGRYIAGMTFFATLVEAVYDKDIFAEVTYVPNGNGATPFLAYLAKIAVRNAINNPFKITNI